MNNLDIILEDFEKISKACEDLDGKTAHIGIIGGGEAAVIAHAHEYGATIRPKNAKYLAIPQPDGSIRQASSVTLPERSFIRASFDQDQSKLDEIARKQIDDVVMKGKSAEAAMNAVGAQAAQLVQNFIDNNRVTPPSNFDYKTQHTTLYETGTHIRDRISYEVEG
ncbi:MAG: hypothetical protein IJ799_02990 [Bacteroidales bacterium]|nr:hypothetical protein [Bacteroidales bacterium]